MSESPHARVSGDVLTLSPVELADLIRAVLADGKPFRFRAPGFSMTPFIKDGDMLTISPLASHSIGIGDVVAIQDPDTKRVIVHRVAWLQDEHLITRGDNCRHADGRISRDDVLGMVTRVERSGRQVRLAPRPAGRVISWLSRNGFLWIALSAYRQVRNWIRVLLLRRDPL